MKSKFFIIIFIILGLCWLGMNEIGRLNSSACEKIRTIAKDPAKIEYIKSWFEENIPAYLASTKRASVRASDNRTLLSTFDIDWRAIGIEPEVAAIYVDSEVMTTQADRRIISFGVGEARERIYIVKEESVFKQNTRFSESQIVSQGVYIRCDGR